MRPGCLLSCSQRVWARQLDGDPRHAVCVLAGYEQELVSRPGPAGFAIGAVLLALVELVGGLLGGPLDEQEHLRQLPLTLDPLDPRRPREVATAAPLHLSLIHI